MNKERFIKELRATAVELKPLTEATSPGDLVWNGTEYAKTSESRTPHPYALCWWGMLGAIAELLEGQESPITSKQTDYLQGLLFGGMGSLNDLFFDPQANGETAKTVNDRLDKQRRILFDSFKDG